MTAKAKRLRKLTPSQRARVEENIPLSLFVLNKPGFANRVRCYQDQRDARQDAALGLCEAVRRFKKSKKRKLSTYANFWFLNQLERGREFETKLHGHLADDADVPEPLTWDPEPVDEAEDGRRVWRHIPKGYRRIVRLRARGLLFREIGARVGLSSSRVAQILIRVREILTAKGLTPELLAAR